VTCVSRHFLRSCSLRVSAVFGVWAASCALSAVLCLYLGCSSCAVSENEVRSRLRSAGVAWSEPIVDADGNLSLDISRNNVTNLGFLRGMPLVALNLYEVPVSDLSPLEGMPLRKLGIDRTNVRDLEPIHSLPLDLLSITQTPIRDLSPLQGMHLRWLFFDVEKVSKGLDAIRRMKTLRIINGLSAQEFWRRHAVVPR
jgi:hypothetical protein